jgi:hypothetical protein
MAVGWSGMVPDPTAAGRIGGRSPGASGRPRQRAFLEVARSELERTRAEVRAEETKMRGS